MNIDQIKAFHKIVATGSFTEAARHLYLTQSAVSQQILALEDEVGVRLFDRSAKRIRMTAEGEALLVYAQRLLDLQDEIESLFGSLKTLQKGKISLGATAVVGTYFMPAVISKYHRQYPGIDIDLQMGNSEQILRMVLDREVDLGIAGMAKKRPELNSVFIHREQLLFVSSPKNPLTAKKKVLLGDLDRIPFIWRERGTQTLTLVKRWFNEKAGGVFPHQTLSLANMEAAKRIVEEGYGVTIIPASAAKREIDAGLLKQLDVEGFALTVDYGLFYTKGKLFSGAAEAFLANLREIGIFSHGENLQGQPWKTP